MANPNLPSFRDATRAQAKACILIEGVAGSGKSGLALAIAYVLADKDWQKVFDVDTENRSLDLFEGIQLHTGDAITPFKKLDLLPTYGYAPSNYVACKENAIQAGALAYINDSITHMWQMEGGILQRVTELEQKNKNINKFSAWGNQEIINEKNQIYNAVRDSRVHVISTVRTKIKHAMETVDGHQTVKSLGEQDIFMPDFEYEPDLVLRMVSPGSSDGNAPVATVQKSRYVIFKAGETYQFTESLIQQLADYLKEGADPSIIQEQQRQELIQVITETLNSNPSKATMFPYLKEQQGVKDVALTDLTLPVLKTLLGLLIN